MAKLVNRTINVEKKDVYDITVDNNHNFFANGILISNCAEITLESFELCNLVELFPSLHESKEEFMETLKYAYLYAKAITLVNTESPETNAVMLKNRRIGVSMTGIVQAFEKFGLRTFLEEFCNDGYQYLNKLDQTYSDWLCVPKSKKLTTVKPSGTISLLAGTTPGIHYPIAEYYIRRVRVSDANDLVQAAKDAGYTVVQDTDSPNTSIIEFPVKVPLFTRCENQVTMWEQFQNAADLQYYWADNSVSITIKFKESEIPDLPRALQRYEDKLKAISFLMQTDITNQYKNPPYEPITAERYEEMVKGIKPIKYGEILTGGVGEKYCTNDTCSL